MKIACFKQSTLHNKNAQRGASLLEAVAYLGIASLVLVGAVSMVGSAFVSAESNRMAEEVIALRTASKKLFAGQIHPENMVPVLLAAKALPATLTVKIPEATTTGTGTGGSGTGTTSPTLKNSFGGIVSIGGPTASGGAGENIFTITYTGVPAETCINVLTATSGWSKAMVEEEEVKKPMTAATVADGCGSGLVTLALSSS